MQQGLVNPSLLILTAAWWNNDTYLLPPDTTNHPTTHPPPHIITKQCKENWPTDFSRAPMQFLHFCVIWCHVCFVCSSIVQKCIASKWQTRLLESSQWSAGHQLIPPSIIQSSKLCHGEGGDMSESSSVQDKITRWWWWWCWWYGWWQWWCPLSSVDDGDSRLPRCQLSCASASQKNVRHPAGPKIYHWLSTWQNLC